MFTVHACPVHYRQLLAWQVYYNVMVTVFQTRSKLFYGNFWRCSGVNGHKRGLSDIQVCHNLLDDTWHISVTYIAAVLHASSQSPPSSFQQSSKLYPLKIKSAVTLRWATNFLRLVATTTFEWCDWKFVGQLSSELHVDAVQLSTCVWKLLNHTEGVVYAVLLIRLIKSLSLFSFQF